MTQAVHVPEQIRSPIERFRPQVRAAVENALSPNSKRAYRAQWRLFLKWTEAHGVSALPAAPETVAAYIVDRADSGVKLATVKLSAAGIFAAHRAAGFDDPAKSQGVRAALAGVSRAIGEPQAQAKALSKDALDAIRQSACVPRVLPCGETESLRTARRRGLVDIALAFALSDSGLRRSEAAALRWADVEEWDSGGGEISGRITVRRSKTDKRGRGETVYLSPAGASALRAIRPADASEDDFVFGFSERQVSRRIKSAAKAAGLGDGFSGHSGRVGLARRLSKAGAPTEVTMRQGRWRSAAMVLKYTRKEDVEEVGKYL